MARNKKSLTEAQIQTEICKYLQGKMDKGELMFWRQNNGGVYDPRTKAYRKSAYSINGVPDILIIKEGWFIGLEVKRPKQKLSKSQKEFKELCEQNGAEYYKVTKIEDLIEIGI